MVLDAHSHTVTLSWELLKHQHFSNLVWEWCLVMVVLICKAWCMVNRCPWTPLWWADYQEPLWWVAIWTLICKTSILWLNSNNNNLSLKARQDLLLQAKFKALMVNWSLKSKFVTFISLTTHLKLIA